PGYSEELDEWRALADGATDYLDKLEIRERERLGLDTLKVGYNAVHATTSRSAAARATSRRSTTCAARR
ncbi:hypothetical protein K28_00495, partial [Klebsiella pneumoniae]